MQNIKKVSWFNQEIPHSYTAGNPRHSEEDPQKTNSQDIWRIIIVMQPNLSTPSTWLQN